MGTGPEPGEEQSRVTRKREVVQVPVHAQVGDAVHAVGGWVHIPIEQHFDGTYPGATELGHIAYEQQPAIAHHGHAVAQLIHLAQYVT